MSAQVAELVDALASGASIRKDVEVQVLSWAPRTSDSQRTTPVSRFAQMAELVDALASGASIRKDVEVQVLFWAPRCALEQGTWYPLPRISCSFSCKTQLLRLQHTT